MRTGLLLLIGLASCACALAQKTVDLTTRPGVSLRLLVLQAAEPKATLVLLPGGPGGLQLFPNGSMPWGENNFLVRTRQLFVDQGFNVAIVDAPSDRPAPAFLNGFRQRPEHAADIQAVIAWARETGKAPVWLVGTSRGTQSAGYVATELSGADAPDGVVLTASILADERARPVGAMLLGKVSVPVLLVHHEQDGCLHCPVAQAQPVIDRLARSPRKQLIVVSGGNNVGDPCQPMAYHGFNGIEAAVVSQIVGWIGAK